MDSHEEIINQIDKVKERIRKLVAIPSTERTTEQKNKLRQLRNHLKEIGEAEDEMIRKEAGC